MDIVLQNVDEVLAERIRRVAEARGWTLPQTWLHLVEQGLYACEADTPGFDRQEAEALQAALAALQAVPDDPGYAMIGRRAPRDAR
ncbi:hypothetical protein [Luteimonas huabeiensis]|uniref:hypothetical protein n=1 Tax=Luteimonas huabeiensis TaxID=1244513 RepID=UPI0004644BBA|nr:hypothetical protein [Luteimonas huabeiensis]